MSASEQLYIALGLPMAWNAVLYALLLLNFKVQFDKLEKKLDASIARTARETQLAMERVRADAERR